MGFSAFLEALFQGWARLALVHDRFLCRVRSVLAAIEQGYRQ